MKQLQPDDYGIRYRTEADQKEMEVLRRKSRENEQHIALLKLYIVALEKELTLRKVSPLSKHWRAADPILPPPTESIEKMLPPGPSFNSETRP